MGFIGNTHNPLFRVLSAQGRATSSCCYITIGELRMWIDFKKEQPKSDSDLYQVFCYYNACKEQNVAYVGDNGFFYSEETDKMLPVTHWKELEDDPK